jgi:hypothetical protein
VIPPAKLVDEQVALKKKEELRNALQKYGQPAVSSFTSPVKCQEPYSLTKTQQELELSPLEPITAYLKGAGKQKAVKGANKAAPSSSKFVVPFIRPESSPKGSSVKATTTNQDSPFKTLFVNSPNSNKFRTTPVPTTTSPKFVPIIPKIGPPVIPKSKRKLILREPSSKAFKSPLNPNPNVNKNEPSTSTSKAVPTSEPEDIVAAGILRIKNSFKKKSY